MMTTPEKAVRVMNQLQGGIYNKPLKNLENVFNHGTGLIRDVDGVPPLISLCEALEDVFEIKGSKQVAIVNKTRTHEVITTLHIDITLRIPKKDGEQESGEWTWFIE